MTAHLKRLTAVAAVLMLLEGTASAQNETLQSGVAGLLEPFRTVNLSASDSGVLIRLPVVEGQRVSAGEVIAQLDDELQATQLKIAHQRMVSHGELDVARAELQLRRKRLEQLEMLLAEGHARHEEVQRARAELDMAAARLVSQQEDQTVRELERLRAEQTLARRKIRSPINGVVAQLDRQEGEYLSPVRPEIGQIIQTNPLLGVFPVPLPEVSKLRPGAEVSVHVGDHSPQRGTIQSVGVTIDSASQTVQVKVRLQNNEGALIVGQPCILRGPVKLPSTDAADRPGRSETSQQAAAARPRSTVPARRRAWPTSATSYGKPFPLPAAP